MDKLKSRGRKKNSDSEQKLANQNNSFLLCPLCFYMSIEVDKSIFCQEKFKKKLTTHACRMEFFTLITQVSSRSDHSDARTGQAHEVS